MSQNGIEEIQNLLRKFQNAMKAKSSTVRGQWNSVTCLEKLSQAQLARRMNVFGVNATNNDVAQIFYYIGVKKNSMDFNDFITLMETDPESLGAKSRSMSRTKGIEHETLRAFENDYNKYCRRTGAFTPSVQTRTSFNTDLTQPKAKKIARPFTTTGTQITRESNYGTQFTKKRKQKNVIKTKINHGDGNINEENNNFSYDDDGQNYTESYDDNHHHHHNCSNTLGGSGTFSYETCKTCMERSLPFDKSTKKATETTLRSFSNSSIQRQDYDGTDPLKTLNRSSGISMNDLVSTISDIAYTSCPSSWACFLKWRDPHHDLLDANDLRNGLKRENKLVISQADAQRVIDKYGGPMNHSTFAVMLHDGSQFNRERTFDDNDI